MFEAAQAVALVAFVLVAIVVVIGAGRTGRLLARTREAEVFRESVLDLARRVELSLGSVSERVDAVRRGDVEPDSIAENIAAALDAVGRYASEARALTGPREAWAARDEIVLEVERLGRALDMVEHGCAIRSGRRKGEGGAEAETSIKRGYLNLLHAREAVARHADDAVRLAEGASPVRRFGRRGHSM